MLRIISILSFVILVSGVALWASGALDGISAWAADWQRQVQTSMARGLRALRAGEPGALIALLTICFSYGFFHAVGPGHGKVLIGGYSLASKATMWRMSLVALLSSLAQGLSAILLVFAGVLVLNLTRQQMVGLAEDWFADASYGAIALIGLYLLVRGARKLFRVSRGAAHSHDHDHAGHAHHHHDDPNFCHDCGHAHAPDLHAVEAAGGWRELAVLIAGVAIRPCTGALFLLVLTWQMGLVWQGILGVVAMALGTATVTIVTALAAVSLRGGLLAAVLNGGGSMATRAVPMLEIAAGALIVIVALGLLGLV
ncbi:ABC-type nickel/cobalt efflux system, permease component RcnA [Aliiroseovarius halocynthiae]|uniref:Nickel/cobalt efflux system n=1 Tax=Aliiroseovarius halocynthiae TaxID=985055 RepID=A0A545SL29_9RHOB|nr:hypothetical protein [Aliiroseovarius halocynthiae]TQV65671.1 hypothetical protein FIL88_16325 [Aliiroseovarius halocynthiae]SMR84071.1 ABC-type nickel/cobalt efflux system, permease component RcnA [Aliiroseovarius halocynthiae]